MNKGVPSSRDPRTLIQIAEEGRIQKRNEVIGLFIVVVEVFIIADENDCGLQSHALVNCNDIEKRSLSGDTEGKINDKIIFKLEAGKLTNIRVALIAVEEHPVKVDRDQLMGELKVDMPCQSANIPPRWFQLRPTKD